MKAKTQLALSNFYDLCTQVLEDQQVELHEAQQVEDWLNDNKWAFESTDYREFMQSIHKTFEHMIEDGHLDAQETQDAFVLLSEFCTMYETLEKYGTFKGLDAYKAQIASLDALEQNKFYIIDYKDAAKNVTQRKILFYNLSHGNNGLCLNGHCTLRDARRAFLVDRIQAIFCAESGEQI